MTTRSRKPQQPTKPQIDRSDLARLLLEVLPGKPGKPSTEAFKRTLEQEFGGALGTRNQNSDQHLRRVAQDLLRQLEQTKGIRRQTTAPLRRQPAPGSSNNATPSALSKLASPRAEKLGATEDPSLRFKDEHPAIIAQRLRRLPSKSQDLELNRLSGELARQVRFLIWQLK